MEKRISRTSHACYSKKHSFAIYRYELDGPCGCYVGVKKIYIGLRAYAQKDPVLEYKMEGFDMFEEMTRNIKFAVSDNILKLKIVRRVATPTETQEVSNE